MALPVIKTPTYELVVPSTKQKVKYRPFLVKEEKALLIAQQSEDQQTMFDTLKSIVDACTFGKVDTNKLATFDIEYIFLQLRAKSVGEISELVFSCLQCNDPKAKINVLIDLTKINVKFNDNHISDIQLYGDVGIRMKYPSMSTVNTLKNLNSGEVEGVFDVIVQCIDCIYDADSVHVATEQTKADLEEFINNLTQLQFEKIKQFFETMPKLEKTIEFKCPVCGFEHKQVIEGLDGFF